MSARNYVVSGVCELDGLDGQSEYGNDAIHRLIFPTYRARSVRLIVPEAGAGRV